MIFARQGFSHSAKGLENFHQVLVPSLRKNPPVPGGGLARICETEIM